MGERRGFERGGGKDGSNRKKERRGAKQPGIRQAAAQLYQEKEGFMSSESRAQQEKMVAVFLGVQTVDAHFCDSVWDLAEKEERRGGSWFSCP